MLLLLLKVQCEQPSGPMKLKWRRGLPTPESTGEIDGTAVVHGSTAYFSSGYNVYSYTVPDNKWIKLPQCKYGYFAMAVIDNQLTTIGGREMAATNTLLSLSGSSWEEVLPPMPTNRVLPAAANTPTHLVVAGGRQSLVGSRKATAEILNIETVQWSTASTLPEIIGYPQMIACGGRFYLASSVCCIFSCSFEDLLKSTNSSDGDSVWTRLASIPTPRWSSIATLRGRVLAVGGKCGGYPTGAIHCYDVATNSWCVVGEMATPRSGVLTAVLPSNELVVVGGKLSGSNRCTITEITSCNIE